MPRNNIVKQINAIQKSIDDLEKAHKRWPSPTPPREKDTKEDRQRPIDTPPDVPKKPPYDPEGDTAPATQSTRAFAESAARRNKASEDRRMKEVPPEPVTSPGDEKRIDLPPEATSQINEAMQRNRKPPYKMEYLDEVELDLKGDEIPMDKDDYRNVEGVPQHVKSEARAKKEIATGKAKRQGPEGTRVPTGRPTSEPEENFDMMRKSIEKSLLKLMQYGGA